LKYNNNIQGAVSVSRYWVPALKRSCIKQNEIDMAYRED
jgi:hypothetical protein